MNIYKYQILKYLESKNLSIKELKNCPKDELLNKYLKFVDKSELTKYLNKRKQRQPDISKYKNISEQKIIIVWDNIYLWI